MLVVLSCKRMNFLGGVFEMASVPRVGEAYDRVNFLVRGISQPPHKEPLGDYFQISEEVMESNPLWALYSYLETDTNDIPDDKPMISITDQKDAAEISFDTGKKKVNLKFTSITHPD